MWLKVMQLECSTSSAANGSSETSSISESPDSALLASLSRGEGTAGRPGFIFCSCFSAETAGDCCTSDVSKEKPFASLMALMSSSSDRLPLPCDSEPDGSVHRKKGRKKEKKINKKWYFLAAQATNNRFDASIEPSRRAGNTGRKSSHLRWLTVITACPRRLFPTL